MGKCHSRHHSFRRHAAADRPRRWRANRHAGHPGADVRCHRPAVPPARQAARRRHGGVRDDRLLGDDPGEPQDAGDGRDGRRAAASARCSSPAASPTAMAEAARLAVDRGRRPDRHQLRLPGEEGGARPAGRLGADARRGRRRGDPRGDRARRPRAGDAEDAHGLGPRQPERAAACAHRPGLRHPHGHRARPHPPAILHRRGRLGLHRSR